MAKPKYASAAQMQPLIDQYFAQCGPRYQTDTDGQIILDGHYRPIKVGERPPTITGLAHALGFVSRNSLLSYHGKAAFTDCIDRAKSRVEQYAEERLFDRDGFSGARFALMMNFRWGRAMSEDEGPGGKTVVMKGLVDCGCS